MIKYIDKGTARQHLTDRLIECALNNVGVKADVDAVFLNIAKNRLPVWMDELQTYDVQEVRHGRWRKERVSSTGRGSYWVYQCSICGAMFPDIGYGYNYCPNCGASMRGEEDANE